MSLYPITFQSQFRERVWGGRRLSELFGKDLPPGRLIGESWEITDRPEGVSLIANGPWAGRDLRWLMETHGADILGRPVANGERFPWLIKILDARDDLSLQVHPPASKAAALGGEPKTEAWYFAATEPGAKIYVGLNPGVSRDEFLARAEDGSVAGCFHVESPQAGDVMFVPSGRVHALGGGNVVFEVQQNSDTTYRVFDWNRPGLDGRPRELHLPASMESIDFTDFSPGLIRSSSEEVGPVRRRTLVNDPVFHIKEWRLVDGITIPDGRDHRTCCVLAVVDGALWVRGGGEEVKARAGDFVLLPAAMEPAALETTAETTLMHITLPWKDQP